LCLKRQTRNRETDRSETEETGQKIDQAAVKITEGVECLQIEAPWREAARQDRDSSQKHSATKVLILEVRCKMRGEQIVTISVR